MPSRRILYVRGAESAHLVRARRSSRRVVYAHTVESARHAHDGRPGYARKPGRWNRSLPSHAHATPRATSRGPPAAPRPGRGRVAATPAGRHRQRDTGSDTPGHRVSNCQGEPGLGPERGADRPGTTVTLVPATSGRRRSGGTGDLASDGALASYVQQFDSGSRPTCRGRMEGSRSRIWRGWSPRSSAIWRDKVHPRTPACGR